MDPKTQRLVDAVKALQKQLDHDGEYGLCRKDGEAMGLGDFIPLGDILQEIEDAIYFLERCTAIGAIANRAQQE
jgi:hypothetical protein